ncbi:MAG TPA: GntG family PLP-dependent aldolase [Symbiobacteriaceae bacterium]|nr:GntG family PLP-dependent aldolase [Symbiobacteriaceae bacterium]
MTAFVDLRSDTVTRPTPAMRRAMADAEVGDDVYGEDPTVSRLEQLAAAKVGKEAALFVPTGTMGNQIAVMTHTARGDQAILDVDSHIYQAEVGGLAVLSGVQARTLKNRDGCLDPAEVEEFIWPEDIHFPRLSLVCLENPLNDAGGIAAPVAAMEAVCAVAHRHGLAAHLDGARVFNAAAALGVSAADVARPFDSVMFCLSKGLCAPVGSMVAGPAAWIARARKHRKLLGGGMRQVGVLAAAGIVALEQMVDRLAEDHANARRLADGLATVPFITLDPARVDTNMVFIRYRKPGKTADDLVEALAERGVRVGAVGADRLRLVTHHDVPADAIPAVLKAFGQAV